MLITSAILSIIDKSKGREQFTVTRDFIPFTLEVLQSKYLLFLLYLNFSKAGINLQQILAGWAGVFACKILSGWASFLFNCFN